MTTQAKAQFEKDLNVMLQVNGKPMSRAIWNLIISKRDLALFCKGMKPHRYWRFNDVKIYFGLKGNKHKVYEQLCEMVNTIVYEPTK